MSFGTWLAWPMCGIKLEDISLEGEREIESSEIEEKIKIEQRNRKSENAGRERERDVRNDIAPRFLIMFESDITLYIIKLVFINTSLAQSPFNPHPKLRIPIYTYENPRPS